MATLSTSTPVNIQINVERWVLSLIALTLVGRLLLASTLGLGIDESYTVATARTFVLSTYDHPPLAWWLAGASRWMFGSEARSSLPLRWHALSRPRADGPQTDV